MEFYAELTIEGRWLMFIENLGVRTQLIGPTDTLENLLQKAVATGSPLRLPLVPGPLPSLRRIITQIPSQE